MTMTFLSDVELNIEALNEPKSEKTMLENVISRHSNLTKIYRVINIDIRIDPNTS